MHIPPCAQNDLTRSLLKSEEGLERLSTFIISGCLDHEEFFSNARLCVNFDAHTKQYEHQDLADVLDNVIFHVLLEFTATSMVSGSHLRPANRAGWLMNLTPFLQRFFDRYPDWPRELFGQVITRLLTLPATTATSLGTAVDGLIDYVHITRCNKIVAKLHGADGAAMVDELASIPGSVSHPSTAKSLYDAQDILELIKNFKPEDRRPMYTGVTEFDRKYGSLCAPGDLWLVFASSGGGKSIWAAQTAGQTAKRGHKVLLAITEMSPQQIFLRTVSSVTGRSYKLVETMLGADPAQHALRVDLENFIRNVGCNLTINDYRAVKGRHFPERVDRLMDTFHKKHGCLPDLFILDWLGTAVDGTFPSAWEKREGYLKAVEYMALEIADGKKMAVAVTTQAVETSIRKAQLVADDMAECRAAWRPAEGLLGISALNRDNSAGPGKNKKDEQVWNVPKARAADTVSIPVKRDFERMRFVDP